MREAGLVGACHRRTGPTATQRDQEARPAPDLVDRSFKADAPDVLWVADMTYVPTHTGFLYLAVVLDVFSRRDDPTVRLRPKSRRPQSTIRVRGSASLMVPPSGEALPIKVEGAEVAALQREKEIGPAATARKGGNLRIEVGSDGEIIETQRPPSHLGGLTLGRLKP